VFDVFNPSIHNLAKPTDGAETDEEPPFTLADGRTIVRRHRMVDRDLIRQVNTGELVYYVTHPDGRQERLVHPIQMRCIFRFEAEHLLARAGFTVDQVYSDFDRSLSESRYSGELIFVARRTARERNRRRVTRNTVEQAHHRARCLTLQPRTRRPNSQLSRSTRPTASSVANSSSPISASVRLRIRSVKQVFGTARI